MKFAICLWYLPVYNKHGNFELLPAHVCNLPPSPPLSLSLLPSLSLPPSPCLQLSHISSFTSEEALGSPLLGILQPLLECIQSLSSSFPSLFPALKDDTQQCFFSAKQQCFFSGKHNVSDKHMHCFSPLCSYSWL